MVERSIDKKAFIKESSFRAFGVYIALFFYGVSIFYVYFLGADKTAFESDTKVITIAHWQLEDGFREGFNDAIALFELLKAHQFDKLIENYEQQRAEGFKLLIIEFMQRDPSKNDSDFRRNLRIFKRELKPTYTVAQQIIDQILAEEKDVRKVDFASMPQAQQKEYEWTMNFVNRIKTQEYSDEFYDYVRGFNEATKRGCDWVQKAIEYAKNNTKPQKVKIIQSAVPARAYSQWFITQLIGGKPADIIELRSTSNVYQQYFNPLSSYVGKPNKYNYGTVLQGMPWKDTYIDGMESALDYSFSEYFGVGMTFHTVRLFINLDLLEKATGSKEMPQDLTEWLDICNKVKEYGQRIGKPVIPIGVRGLDRATLYGLWTYYFSQLNGNLNDIAMRYYVANSDALAEPDSMREILHDDPEERERMLAACEIIRDIGQFFGDGFTAMDLEQTKFQFFSGNTAFLPAGSWNGYSFLRNSQFEVGILKIPVVGFKHKFSKYYSGPIAESNTKVGCNFGIPKATKNFETALDFLQFITSYQINQMAMMRAKWPAAVKKAQYYELLKKFEPQKEGNLQILLPFYLYTSSSSFRKSMEWLEEIILKNVMDPGHYFYDNFKKYSVPRMIGDNEEIRHGVNRDETYMEMQRSQMSLTAMLSGLSEPKRQALILRQQMAEENLAINIHNNRNLMKSTKLLKEFLE
ncbi:MAG: extracellular solute-binding protein [Phycisphaerae bacterium]|jgi:ABC-type glycerol-3-phosphate transport system substrate-binding protein